VTIGYIQPYCLSRLGHALETIGYI